MNHFLQYFMGSSTRPWLRNDGSERLFTLRLKQVENPLDPDALWEDEYGGGSSMIESISKSSTRRLKVALDAHRRLTPQKQEFDFAVENMQVFSDVVVWLPSTLWHHSSREGGERLFMLSEKLKYRHRTDFGDALYQQKPPCYAIMPLDSLAADEVMFQFGKGVFLPDSNAQQTATIKVLQTGKAPIALANWIFFEESQEIERPSALYSQQHFLLVAASHQEAALQSPYWLTQENADNPTPANGSIMVDTHRDPERIYSYGNDIGVGTITAQEDGIRCEFYAQQNKNNTLQLYIQRLTPLDEKVTEHAEEDNTTRIQAKSSYPNETIIDRHDESLLSGLTSLNIQQHTNDLRYQIAIIGIVLPRIEGAGIRYWILSLNAAGMPAEADETVRYRIRGNTHLDALQWCDTQIGIEHTTPAWQPLTLETDLPFLSTHELHLEPPKIAQKHYAVLPLTHVLAYPLSARKITIGRYEAKSKHNADIALNLLSRTDSIEWIRASRRKQTMEHLGTSAQHLQLSIKGIRLQLKHISQSSPSYILQQDTVIKTLAAKSAAKVSLSARQTIIMGNYLLQFQQDYTGDDKA